MPVSFAVLALLVFKVWPKPPTPEVVVPTLTDCQALYQAGYTTSGVYTISPDGVRKMSVYCEQSLDGGGWTVIQQRRDNSTDFYLSWSDYLTGFGDATTNYWLGLENIRLLTQNMDQQLKVRLRHPDTSLGVNSDGYATAEYNSFYIDDESYDYTLHVANFTDDGVAGDSLTLGHNGQPFSTKDVDNDISPLHCAASALGAWWYKNCGQSNLNGPYIRTASGPGMDWGSWTGLTFVQMMIKPA